MPRAAASRRGACSSTARTACGSSPPRTARRVVSRRGAPRYLRPREREAEAGRRRLRPHRDESPCAPRLRDPRRARGRHRAPRPGGEVVARRAGDAHGRLRLRAGRRAVPPRRPHRALRASHTRELRPRPGAQAAPPPPRDLSPRRQGGGARPHARAAVALLEGRARQGRARAGAWAEDGGPSRGREEARARARDGSRATAAPMRRAALGLLASTLACAVGSAEPVHEYVHNRDDYLAFRDVWPEVLEPNYRPFMVHDVPAHPVSAWRRPLVWLGLAAPPERRLVFCHWAPEDMPLAVWIEPPVALDAIDEKPGREPARYVEAVERALDTWQSNLDGAVRFERASSRQAADLELRLLAERAPEPTGDVRVYGAATVGDSSEVLGGDP